MSGLNAERTVTRTEAAEYLREFADKLANGQVAGGQTTDHTASGTTSSGSTTTGEATTHGSTEGTGTPTDQTGTPTDQTGTTTDQTGTTTDQTGENQASTHHQYGKVTFLVGNDSATVNPPEEVTLNVDVGEDSSMMSSGAETVTFSLHWDKKAVPESDELRIE